MQTLGEFRKIGATALGHAVKMNKSSGQNSSSISQLAHVIANIKKPEQATR